MEKKLPYIFIGSATESVDIAREIKLQLEGKARVKIWKYDVSRLGEYFLESLLKIVNDFDYALFIFSNDDKTTSRNTEYNVPRDNVIFEVGLFMGRLGRSRTFIIYDEGSKVKVPSDLLGLTMATYTMAGSLSETLSPVCTKLIKNIGPIGSHHDPNILQKMKEYSDGLRMESWQTIYQRATDLISNAQRRVRATSFGIGSWKGNDAYIESIVKTCQERKIQKVDFVYKVIFGSSTENIGIRKQNMRKRMEYFEKEDVLDCLMMRELDEIWGIDILIVDDKHLHLAFQQASGRALVFGIEIRDHPELVRRLAEWFDEFLFAKAREPRLD